MYLYQCVINLRIEIIGKEKLLFNIVKWGKRKVYSPDTNPIQNVQIKMLGRGSNHNAKTRMKAF